MNSLVVRILLAVLLFQFAGFTVFAQQAAYSPAIEQRIKKVEKTLGLWAQIEGRKNSYNLQERMDYHRVNGISIAVIKDNKMEWARGYGWANRAEQQPVTTATLFQAGSISKSLNAVGVLKLVQEGKLDLLVDINNYLASWKFPYDSIANNKKITTANLLSHTAGLTVHGFPGYEVGTKIPTIAQVLDGVTPANTKAVRSAFEPGLKYQYSGGGTTISQVLVEDITGKPYDVYMWDNVLKPLGMLNSFYTQPPAIEKLPMMATAYYNDGKPVTGRFHIYPEQAAAGLWTNPTDLAKYIIETQLALQGNSGKVLTQQMTKLRLTPYVDSTAALGVFVYKEGENTYFEHGGVDEGFVAQYYGSMEDGTGVVVMANTYNTAILHEIINSVATVYDWKGFYSPQQKKLVKIEDAILNNYLGNYQVNNNIVSFEKAAHGLMAVQGGIKMEVYFTSETDFFIMEAPEVEFSFLKDADNKVTGIERRSGGKVIILSKVL